MSIKPSIKAREVVADLLSGAQDSDLMTKHGVTAQELNSLLSYLVDTGLVAKSLLALSDSQIARAFVDSREEVKDLEREPPQPRARESSQEERWDDWKPVKTKRVIRAAEVVRDIRLKMTDLEIMEKYRLSRQGLESLLEKLLAAGLITSEEFHWRPAEYDDTVVLDCDRLEFP